MNRFPRLFSRLAMLALVGAMLALGACSSGVKSEKTTKLENAIHFKIKAYKSGQFLLDGAVLSPMDLSSHFAYLRDQHRLPNKVLLTRSDESSIHKVQLLAMARMRMTYGFQVFFVKDGKLVRLALSNKDKVPQLKHRNRNSVPLPNRINDGSAKGGNKLPGMGN